MNPIETNYKGYRFRSRLEAKWAVFFDALDIKWEYELEGFEFSDGQRYLPDFYLPTFCGGMYCEVKYNKGDFSKAWQFCEESGDSIWLCEGVPDYKIYKFLMLLNKDNDDYEPFVEDFEGVPNFADAKEEDRMFWQPEEDIRNAYFEDEDLMNAVNAVRSARFEFGESGAAMNYNL